MRTGELKIPPLEDDLQIFKPLRGDQHRATIQWLPQLTVGVYWSQRRPTRPVCSHWFGQKGAAVQKLQVNNRWKAQAKKWWMIGRRYVSETMNGLSYFYFFV